MIIKTSDFTGLQLFDNLTVLKKENFIQIYRRQLSIMKYYLAGNENALSV